MASFNYTARPSRSKTDNHYIIYLTFSYGRGKLFRTSTGFTVKSAGNWDVKKQKIRNIIDEPNAAIYNNRLNELKTFFENGYDELTTEGEAIDNHRLKALFATFEQTATATNKKNTKDFIALFEQFITASEDGSRRTNKGSKITIGTIKTYKTTLSFFRDFQREYGAIRFGSIDLPFYNRLVQHCEDNGLSQNYTGKTIKVLKTFLKYAAKTHDVKLSSKYDPDDFVVLKEEVDEIYLTNEELMRMYHLDLSAMGHKYERARDLFLIGAYTGLRISDFAKLTKDHLFTQKGQPYFKVTAKKTGNEVIIPVANIVQQIIERNDGLPETMPDQSLNRLIKDVCEFAGIDETVKMTRTVGGQKVKQSHQKYELVKSHTARRSFCTNAYLGDMDTLSIMAISGHTTESNFLKYIKVTKQQQAERIANHPYFKSLSPENFEVDGSVKLKAV